MTARLAERSAPRMVLLDRDGVLNEDRAQSVTAPEELVLLPGAAAAVARLNRAGLRVVVVTNQAVVGRGVIDLATLERIHARLEAEIAQAGGRLDEIIVCTDHPERAGDRRKPSPGMLREALERAGAHPARTPMIGDSLKDLEAAAAAGCPRILVRTGKGAATEAAGLPSHVLPVAVYDDLAAAVDALLGAAGSGAGGQPRARRRLARAALAAAALFVAAWAAGLAWFVDAMPTRVDDPTRETDAVVVLTGGAGRLRAGLDLLSAGRARRLFVSGVHRDVGVAQLLGREPEIPERLACCIDLGYEAGDTVGNARETARWMRARGFRSLRLVTGNYHLPRSLLEFRRVMPDIEIVPHPVFPGEVEGWWRRPTSLWLIAGEYTKYLLAGLRYSLVGPAGGSA